MKKQWKSRFNKLRFISKSPAEPTAAKESKEPFMKDYGWFSNIFYNIKASKEWDKKLFYYQLLPVLPSVTAVYLGILLPAELVSGLESHLEFQALALRILTLSLCMCLLKMADKLMNQYLYRNYQTLAMYYEKKCYHKVMQLNYQMLEDSDCGKLIGNTWNVLRGEFGFRDSLCAIPMVLGSILGILWYGTMIASKNYLIIFLAMANTLFSTWLLSVIRKKHGQLHEKVGAYSKKTAYISKQSMNKQAGKDIRIYQMADWFLKKYDKALEGMDSIYKQIHNGYFWRAIGEGAVTFLVNLFSYMYLIHLLLKGELAVSAFVLYIGLIGSFSNYFGQLLNQLATLNPVCVSVNYIRNFLALPESPGWSEQGVGKEKMAQLKKEGVQVELKNVSYFYAEGEKAALSHMNLVISQGEKLALIGLNGAGKTTLVKLLCGFYVPSQGEILINGIPVPDFRREEYFALISVLFQDATLLPMTLDFNLTGEAAEKIDRKRLEWALKTSGFFEKYQSLPDKGESFLVREASAGVSTKEDKEKEMGQADEKAKQADSTGTGSNAVDFSGGEKQKLLFARALYKKASLMILDEPTAALDPIAENEMYLKFDEAASGRTCVYISHRLSSTRFCDRIILMEKGRIAEEGTHEGLMAKNGRYAQLFEMQSRYYKEQEKRKEQSSLMEDAFEEQEGKEVFYE